MPKVHPGHEVLSLFGIGHKSSVLNKVADHNLTAAMISAFFIVIISALLLGLSARTLPFASVQASTVKVTSGTEPVAYQPGQLVSNEITKGYLAP